MRKTTLFSFLLLLLLCYVVSPSLASIDDDDFGEDVEDIITTNNNNKKTLQQEDEWGFDEDEFEGFDQLKKEKKPFEPTNSDKTSSTSPGLAEPVNRPKFGLLEASYISFLVVFLVNYYFGKKQNETLANSWALTAKDLLKENFSKFGGSTTFLLTKHNANTFDVSCTGKQNCIGALFSLDLKKRHDLTSYFTAYITPTSDVLTIEVAMQPTQPFCFAIVKKKEEKQLRNLPEISEYANQSKAPASLTTKFVVHTDAPEVVDMILSKDMVEALNVYEPFISKIIYSDQSEQYDQYKNMLKIVMKIPPSEEMQTTMKSLIKMSLHIIDSVQSARLTKPALAKTEALRSKHTQAAAKQQHELQQQIAQQKKQERKQIEDQKYAKMTPEQQAKADDKERKKQMKAKAGKGKAVKMMFA
eukprot:TRINITY_DN5556_c0_g1_i1.p1 TRINITY_DN5556_c0_g1~~TRINITY_DN5556_c0_g1_i1.p1  ORF type:complete len:415 (+),score=135.86 TRINITY_DN5556_c0_g1_i1:29-1273(+)